MAKKVIYCLDCSQDYYKELQGKGFDVITGNLGYGRESSRIMQLKEPPNESDLLVFNLTNPACFDATKWGPGLNDNFQCKLVDKIDKSIFLDATFGKTIRYPVFRLIQESQIIHNISLFNYGHVQKAIFEAGLDCIYFLNPIYMFHSLYRIPSWLGFSFETDITKTSKWLISNEAQITCKALTMLGEGDLELESPIQFKLLKLISSNSYFEKNNISPLILITNNINEWLALIVRFGKGHIYFLPPFTKPAAGTITLFNKLIPEFKSTFRKEGALQDKTNEISAATKMTGAKKTWDVFISYASEDRKEVVEPLAKALNGKGLKVWYDKAVLTIGDRLLHKIDEGLSNSEFGIVILSHAFFSKDWPRNELDGLIQKEIGNKKVILPVWHGVNRSDIVRYSPILAGRLAGLTSNGLDKLAEELIAAMAGDKPFIVSDQVPQKDIEVKINFKNINIDAYLHNYSIIFSMKLNRPPSKSGFKAEILWPKLVTITKMENLKEEKGIDINKLIYRKIIFETDEKIYPGDEVEVISPAGRSTIEYEFNHAIWDTVEEKGNIFLYWKIYFKDQMPESGEINFKQLNIF
jgi:hypothetical protein